MNALVTFSSVTLELYQLPHTSKYCGVDKGLTKKNQELKEEYESILRPILMMARYAHTQPNFSFLRLEGGGGVLI